MAHILITGGRGFIGQALCPALLAEAHSITVLTRDPEAAARRLPPPVAYIDRLDAIADIPPVDVLINLAGEPLAGRRWNPQRKSLFLSSRVELTRHLASYFSRNTPPKVVVNGSAIGFYGPHGDEVLDESSDGVTSFSHQLCAEWEGQAMAFEDLGARVCCLRIGIVLGSGGGALSAMLPAFRAGLGGPMGSGRQWMSWVHRTDLVRLILHCLSCEEVRGPVNGTAPEPVTNREFSRTLGRVLHRPAVLPMPGFALRLLFGEMADELLLSGQRVAPAKALATGFEFQFPELEPALADVLSANGNSANGS